MLVACALLVWCGAGLVAPRTLPEPSAEDLEEIKTLDAQLKARRYRVELFTMQAEPLRKEAAALGVGELAGYTTVVCCPGLQPCRSPLMPGCIPVKVESVELVDVCVQT